MTDPTPPDLGMETMPVISTPPPTDSMTGVDVRLGPEAMFIVALTVVVLATQAILAQLHRRHR